MACMPLELSKNGEKSTAVLRICSQPVSRVIKQHAALPSSFKSSTFQIFLNPNQDILIMLNLNVGHVIANLPMGQLSINSYVVAIKI